MHLQNVGKTETMLMGIKLATSMTWGIWVYLTPDSASSMISSKDFSKFGIRGQTSPTCPGRPRADRCREKHIEIWYVEAGMTHCIGIAKLVILLDVTLHWWYFNKFKWIVSDFAFIWVDYRVSIMLRAYSHRCCIYKCRLATHWDNNHIQQYLFCIWLLCCCRWKSCWNCSCDAQGKQQGRLLRRQLNTFLMLDAAWGKEEICEEEMEEEDIQIHTLTIIHAITSMNKDEGDYVLTCLTLYVCMLPT